MKNLNIYISEALIKNHITENDGYVDLGLPSKNLWSKEYYRSDSDVYLTTFENIKSLKNNKLSIDEYVPTTDDIQELLDYCNITYNNKQDEYLCVGPNGNSIAFKCVGWKLGREDKLLWKNDKFGAKFWASNYANKVISFDKKKLIYISNESFYFPIRLIKKVHAL